MTGVSKDGEGKEQSCRHHVGVSQTPADIGRNAVSPNALMTGLSYNTAILVLCFYPQVIYKQDIQQIFQFKTALFMGAKRWKQGLVSGLSKFCKHEGLDWIPRTQVIILGVVVHL